MVVHTTLKLRVFFPQVYPRIPRGLSKLELSKIQKKSGKSMIDSGIDNNDN
jgi:hypothetical protein